MASGTGLPFRTVSEELGVGFTITEFLSAHALSMGDKKTTGKLTASLNGRQFANLAATIPGVGLSFHTDPTKSTQFAPQINGGNGRNVNYQIDGGDNNDDTVGGILQAFPPEAIQEFNFQTQRFKAEYGQAGGGVITFVSKSGTNAFHGVAYNFLRNDDLDARSFFAPTRSIYKQNDFGVAGGGPVIIPKLYNGRNKTVFYLAYG